MRAGRLECLLLTEEPFAADCRAESYLAGRKRTQFDAAQIKRGHFFGCEIAVVRPGYG